MKKFTCVIVMMVWCFCVHAQTQEIQQLKLDLEKLAQLKLMLSQLKNGYQTLQSGLNAVGGAAKGNLNLHKDWLDGLATVSSRVKQSPALQRITRNQSAMQSEYENWLVKIRPLNLLTSAELGSMQSDYKAILEQANEDSELLSTILRSKDLRMDDGERIMAITQLAQRSDEQLSTIRKIIKDRTALLTARARDQREVQEIKKMYGLQ